jgi:t-SNARE complex subunit (syntaxin)
MDDNHRIAEQQRARQMEATRPQSTDEAVQGRMARLDVSQELARYLLDLETRIWELEMDLKELKQRPN